MDPVDIAIISVLLLPFIALFIYGIFKKKSGDYHEPKNKYSSTLSQESRHRARGFSDAFSQKANHPHRDL